MLWKHKVSFHLKFSLNPMTLGFADLRKMCLLSCALQHIELVAAWQVLAFRFPKCVEFGNPVIVNKNSSHGHAAMNIF